MTTPFLISSAPLPPSSGWGKTEFFPSLVPPERTLTGCCVSPTSQSGTMGSTNAQPTTLRAPSHTLIPSLWKVWLCLALNWPSVRATNPLIHMCNKMLSFSGSLWNTSRNIRPIQYIMFHCLILWDCSLVINIHEIYYLKLMNIH